MAGVPVGGAGAVQGAGRRVPQVNMERDACEAAYHRLQQCIRENRNFPPTHLKAAIFGSTLKNVPNMITIPELIAKLKSDFPTELNHSDVRINKFTDTEVPGKEKTMAIISGARGHLRDLQRRSFSKYMTQGLSHFNYVFLPDFGEPRNSNGKRSNPLCGTAYHAIKTREGPKVRTGIRLFNSDFKAKIPYGLLNPEGPSALFVRHSSLRVEDLPQQASYHVQGGNVLVRRISSASELEAIQIIRLMNNTYVRGERVCFQCMKGRLRSTCEDKMGLGVAGEIIPFDDYTHTIPLSWLDPTILDFQFIDSFYGVCPRCNKEYVLISTSTQLDYLTGRCSCDGRCLSFDEWNTELVDASAPFHFPGEVNTRLAYTTGTFFSPKLDAIPFLPQISDQFHSVYDLSNVLLPLLELEWKATKEETNKHQTTAVLDSWETVGPVDKYGYEPRALHIDVTETKFWIQDKSSGFRNASIVVNYTYKDKLADGLIRDLMVKAKLHRTSVIEPGNLRLLYVARWDTNTVIEGRKVIVIPKADKSEYKVCREYLLKLPERFNDRDDYSSMLSRLLIRSSNKPRLFRHLFEIEVYEEKIQRLYATLNKEQKEAFGKAMSCSLSMIQGPPGTGKSYLICCIAVALALKKGGGTILCTAGSNIACNVMYSQIVKILAELKKSSKIPFLEKDIEICRVFSRGKELTMKRGQVDHENSRAYSKHLAPMRALHNLVAEHPRYLTGISALADIATLLAEDSEYKLSDHQRELFNTHVGGIERDILHSQRIVIMTTGCLAAFRVGKPGKDGDFLDDKNIGAILVDEAGVLPVTSSLPLESVKTPIRVYIGDHLQLPPQIHSRAAEHAGLNRSMMELMMQNRNDVEIPNVMLKEQFRAHEDLCKFTSNITYQDKLRTSPTIAKRTNVLKDEFFEAFPELLHNRVWVRSHAGSEHKVGTSSANWSEVEVVLDTVDKFVSGQFMKETDIIVITPYDAQKGILQEMLSSNGFPNVVCRTIDEFQGSEAPVVIVSFVRSNTGKNIGFMMVGNRINVCISRAREAMVICINLDMLEPYADSKGHLGLLHAYLHKYPRITEF